MLFIRVPLPFIRRVGAGLLGQEAARHDAVEKAANDEDFKFRNNVEV